MKLEEVDVVSLQSLERFLTCRNQMSPRRADLIRAFTGSKSRLGGDNDLIAATFDRSAENFLRTARGIDIGTVEHVQSGVEANVHQAGRLFDVSIAPGCK